MIKNKNIELHQIKESSFKIQRNKIVDLIKINRKSHYHKLFDETKRNSKAIRQGIHNIIYSKNAIDLTPLHGLQKEILSLTPRTFQNTSTAVLLQQVKIYKENIAPTKKHFSDYLKAPNTYTFYISPITPKEISELIKTLKSSKSLVLNSIPTNILKRIHETISIPLSTVINKSFATGVFPNICKIAKVVPIFKSETRLLCNNYRAISLLSNIHKIIEKLIHLRLSLFLETGNCYHPFQFSFRSNFSTNIALMSIVENIQILSLMMANTQLVYMLI